GGCPSAEAAARGAPRQVERLIIAIWSSLMIGVVQPLLTLLRLLARLTLLWLLARLTLLRLLARLTLLWLLARLTLLRLLARLTLLWLLARLTLLRLPAPLGLTWLSLAWLSREIEHRRIHLDHIDEDSVDPVESLLQVFERLPRTHDRRVIRRPDLPKGAIETGPGLSNFLLEAGDDHRAGLRDVRRCWCPRRWPPGPVRRRARV